ncbi:tubulin-folding cofactor C [Andrographis paniculata]|uniref:tubulin-folding cofactor C n=1 Tax=Andrographis paniculata TaxID=175694 RepID=UPI0021E71E87|nr:tubulin-folding cofactor C [Andrographis paniculata]
MEENSSTAAAAAMERKHAAMMERLSNRHTARASGKQQDLNSSFASTNSFLSRFAESKQSIESQISEIRSITDPSPKPQLESISLEISDLEKLVAENSYVLPPYEVRTCLNTVAQLKHSLDEATSLIVPKKKFSFKNKTSKKATTTTTATIPDQQNGVVLETNPKSGELGYTELNATASPGFRNRENEALAKEFSGGEFMLSELKGCEVKLKGCLRALFVDNLINSRVYVGAVMGSVLIEGAQGCVFIIASHQIRIHNAKDCDFYLRVRSRPIIEDSNGIRFAPFCLRYEGIEKDLGEACLVEETGDWSNVDDFRWLRAVQSPNWSILPEDHRIRMVDV